MTTFLQHLGWLIRLHSTLPEKHIRTDPSQKEDSDTEHFQVRLGENEVIGDSDLENERKEETPRESLSYKVVIFKLRSRLDSSIFPIPEAK